MYWTAKITSPGIYEEKIANNVADKEQGGQRT